MADEEKDVKQAIMEDLRNNPKYRKFYERFNGLSISRFIESYAGTKANWLDYGKRFFQSDQYRMLKYDDIASQKLWEIQQAKLFEAQCLWRAGTLVIPEVIVTFDFDYWEKGIENCPFLSPISEEEFNMYREYILSPDAELGADTYELNIKSWQEYDKIKDSLSNDNDSSINIPEWFMFYFNRHGGFPCMYLPDIKGEKEDFYRDLYFKRPKEEPAEPPLQYPEDPRPSISCGNDDQLWEFVELFEDRKVIEYARAWEDDDESTYDSIVEAIDTLMHADERIEIEVMNVDWKTALFETVRQYEKRKIYAALEPAYKKYCNRLNLGIAFESYEEQSDLAFYKNLSECYKRGILIGRKLNNEPEDFNY